jgi:hypothetical protein
MSLFEVAKIYTDLVILDKETPDQEFHAKDRIQALRTQYHELLMEQMRKEGIYFVDRFDATRKAFEIIQNKKLQSA